MRAFLTAITFIYWLGSGVLLTRGAAGGELESLIEEYNAAKPKARQSAKNAKGWGGGKGQGPWNRGRTESPLKPILMAIAALGTPQAQAFVQGEFLKERPEVAAACVEPLLKFTSDKVLDVLFSGFQKRDRVVKQEVLEKLAESSRDLTPLEATLVGLLHSEQLAEVRRELPRLLARIGTLSAARALLSSLRARPAPSSRGDGARPPPPPPPGPQGPGGFGGMGRTVERPEDFGKRVVDALKETQSEEVKAWLSGEAFSGAPPARLEALADLAGELKLEAARPHLEKQFEASDEEVALRSLLALIKIGAGPSEASIADALKKGKRGVAFRIHALDCLAASGTPVALAAVKAAAQDPNPETRAVALGSLARIPGANEEALQAILLGLKDPEPLVRGAAIRALQKIRHQDMVPALIELLAQEKDERLQVNALQLLFEVTGKNMGLSAEDWRKWWEVTEPVFEFAKGGGERQPTAGVAHDLKYFGVEIASKRLAFLIDASLSMEQQMDVYLKREQKPEEGKTQVGGGSGPRTRARKIDVLKREMTRVVNGLPKETQINLITFAQSYRSWQETLQPLAGAGREKVLSFVRDINLGFGTNVFDSLEFALKDKRVDTIFLLTDGQPTHGKYVDPPSMLREIQSQNRVRGVVINCIAFGGESEFLKELAAQNGGVYRFVDTY